MKRIETALARIDRSADSLATTGFPADPDASGLREEVAGTLRDLDALIESLEK